MTEKFDPDDSHHRTIREELKLGIALKEIATFSEVNRALESAGYDVIEAANRDDREGRGIPWYWPMESQSGTLRSCFAGRRWAAGRYSRVCDWRRRSGSFRMGPRTWFD